MTVSLTDLAYKVWYTWDVVDYGHAVGVDSQGRQIWTAPVYGNVPHYIDDKGTEIINSLPPLLWTNGTDHNPAYTATLTIAETTDFGVVKGTAGDDVLNGISNIVLPSNLIGNAGNDILNGGTGRTL